MFSKTFTGIILGGGTLIEGCPDNDMAFLLDGTEIHPRFIDDDDQKNVTILVLDFDREKEDEGVI